MFNTLCKRNITVLNIVRQGRKCEIEVPYTHSREVVALLEEKCYNILSIRYRGVIAITRFVRKRFILPVALLLCLIVLAISSQFCFRIEVTGDFDSTAVLQSLSTAGVDVGKSIANLNVDEVENAVANDLDAMYAVVTRKGSVIYVNAVKRKEIDEPIDMNKRRDIVASCNGIVTSVLCEQGTAVAQVGDEVKAGDILIEGLRTFNDGETRDVYALGRVCVEPSVVGVAEYTGYRTVVQRTGNEFKSVGIKLFGKEYSRICPFERFEAETRVTYLYPLNLPIAYNVYYETQQVTVAATKEECIEELKMQAYEKAMLNCDFDVIDVKYTVTDKGVEAKLIGNVELR